jgi:hypothetical protein
VAGQHSSSGSTREPGRSCAYAVRRGAVMFAAVMLLRVVCGGARGPSVVLAMRGRVRRTYISAGPVSNVASEANNARELVPERGHALQLGMADGASWTGGVLRPRRAISLAVCIRRNMGLLRLDGSYCDQMC